MKNRLEEFFSLLKKTLFSTVDQIKNTLDEVGILVKVNQEDIMRVNAEGSLQD